MGQQAGKSSGIAGDLDTLSFDGSEDRGVQMLGFTIGYRDQQVHVGVELGGWFSGGQGLAGQTLVRLDVPRTGLLHNVMRQRWRLLPVCLSQSDSGEVSQSRTNCLSKEGWA